MKPFSIRKRSINQNEKPFIIAEMSGNHNQSFDQALLIIQAAVDCGADALKLQAYTPDTITLDCQKEDFKIKNSDSLWKDQYLYGLYQDAYTDWGWIKEIMLECKKRNLICFSSVSEILVN